MNSTKNIIINMLKKSKMSISEVSAKSGVNKGTLSSIINGTRKPSETSICKILKSGLMTEKERKELADAFFIEEYGLSALNKSKQFISALEDQADFENREFTPFIPNLNDSDFENEYIFLSGSNEILKSIASLLSESFEKNVKIYTNFSSDNKTLDEMVFATLLNYENRTNLCRVVEFTKDNESLKNYDITFSLIKYMQLKVNSYYRVNDSSVITEYELYPYYFISDDSVIFYDKEFCYGAHIKKTDFVMVTHKKIEKQFMKYSLLCHFPENVLSQMDDLRDLTSSEIAIRFNPHIFNLFSKEDWNDCISDKLENKEALAELAYSWYSSERGLSVISYSTTDGWLDFLKTGRILAQPSFLVPDVDIKFRRKMVEKVIENLRAGLLNHRVLSPKIRLPEKLIIEQIGQYIFFVTMSGESLETDWLGSAFLYLPFEVANDDFMILNKYLEINGYLYNEEESIAVLENMLSHCQNEVTIKNILA